MTINKWAKSIPKLDLPARVRLQKASKIKQIWDCGQQTWLWPCLHGMISLLPIGTRSIHRVRTTISNGAVQVWQTD